MRGLHVVLPAAVDDPRRPSGGNHYDRRVCDGLAGLGWSLVEHPVAGDELGEVLTALPNGAAVLVDGLVASGSPDAIRPHAARLRLVALVHLPFGVERSDARVAERVVLSGCTAVVTTSGWTRAWLLEHYGLDAARVHVVHPGVDPAEPVTGTPDGQRLLVVGRVTRAKGHDVLAAALAGLADLPWRCVCVGAVDAEAGFVEVFTRDLGRVADRVELRGPVPPEELGRAYAASDLLIVPSRTETYGMVVTEGLAHGLPVVATAAGGVPEAIGRIPDGRRPGLLVPPGDADELGRALRSWLTDTRLRSGLREAALERRSGLAGWPEMAKRLAQVLAGVHDRGVNHPPGRLVP